MVDEVEVEAAQKQPERLTGYVQIWIEKDKYGFIAVKGAKDPDGSRKQWHFHLNSLKDGTSSNAIAAGVVVRFTPVPCPAVGKRDKATEIEVVG